MGLTRTNLMLPDELVREVDEIAGPRGRSRFVTEAVEYRVKREKLRRAIAATAGCMVRRGSRMDRDQVSAWIRELREAESE